MHRDPDPGAPVALGRVSQEERLEQRPRHHPRHVQVVDGEEEPVDDPVAASEGAVHARKEVPAEEELLTEDRVEQEHGEEEAVPAPGAVQERLTGSDATSVARTRFSGAANVGISSFTAVTARISGIRISQIRPPTRPLRGLRGERSQSASRTVDQRSVRCSRPTRIATSTNCQTSPAVRQMISALNIGTMPVPANRSASAGAASQARAAIGSAAAAQTAKIPRIRSCGMSTPEVTVSARAVAVEEK